MAGGKNCTQACSTSPCNCAGSCKCGSGCQCKSCVCACSDEGCKCGVGCKGVDSCKCESSCTGCKWTPGQSGERLNHRCTLDSARIRYLWPFQQSTLYTIDYVIVWWYILHLTNMAQGMYLLQSLQFSERTLFPQYI